MKPVFYVSKDAQCIQYTPQCGYNIVCTQLIENKNSPHISYGLIIQNIVKSSDKDLTDRIDQYQKNGVELIVLIIDGLCDKLHSEILRYQV